MEKWRWAIYALVVLLIGWGLYSLDSSRSSMKNEAEDLSSQLSVSQNEKQNLLDEIDYLKNPDNLVNKLKEQTSYRKPDEKLIIVTSGATSSGNASTTTSTR
jgi:cell division protein FtsL